MGALSGIGGATGATGATGVAMGSAESGCDAGRPIPIFVAVTGTPCAASARLGSGGWPPRGASMSGVNFVVAAPAVDAPFADTPLVPGA